jgi:hypothetical protein
VVSQATFYRASVSRVESARWSPALSKRTRDKIIVSLAEQVSARGPFLIGAYDRTWDVPVIPGGVEVCQLSP